MVLQNWKLFSHCLKKHYVPIVPVIENLKYIIELPILTRLILFKSSHKYFRKSVKYLSTKPRFKTPNYLISPYMCSIFKQQQNFHILISNKISSWTLCGNFQFNEAISNDYPDFFLNNFQILYSDFKQPSKDIPLTCYIPS